MKTRRWPVEPEGILVRAISIRFPVAETSRRTTKNPAVARRVFSINR
jgi:hypothetical protein